MSDSLVCLRATVRGRVQGVGFRDYVATRARALRLAGRVRNLPDGSVEFTAEGPREAVERLVHHAREGPRMSRVDDVETEWLPATGELSDFRVTG